MVVSQRPRISGTRACPSLEYVELKLNRIVELTNSNNYITIIVVVLLETKVAEPACRGLSQFSIPRLASP
jgi:hypothetical protein